MFAFLRTEKLDATGKAPDQIKTVYPDASSQVNEIAISGPDQKTLGVPKNSVKTQISQNQLNGTQSPKGFGIASNLVIDVPSTTTESSVLVLTNSVSTNKTRKKEKDDDLSMPEWNKIIRPDGSAIDLVGPKGKGSSDGIPDYLQLYRAFEAGYIEEILSNGVATDMSALLVSRDVSDEVLYNGAVSTDHDLGNAFYLLTLSSSGSLRLYTGVERLRGKLPTFIEFELNQGQIRLGPGIPWWDIQGSRTEGDLLVRFNLIAGNLTSVELAIWREDRFLVFESDTQGLAGGCVDKFSYLYCIGTPPLDRSNQFIEVWDDEFVPVEATFADSFVELGLDLGRLIGSGAEFSGLYIRTPEDVALTTFQKMGSSASTSTGFH